MRSARISLSDRRKSLAGAVAAGAAATAGRVASCGLCNTMKPPPTAAAPATSSPIHSQGRAGAGSASGSDRTGWGATGGASGRSASGLVWMSVLCMAVPMGRAESV